MMNVLMIMLYVLVALALVEGAVWWMNRDRIKKNWQAAWQKANKEERKRR